MATTTSPTAEATRAPASRRRALAHHARDAHACPAHAPASQRRDHVRRASRHHRGISRGSLSRGSLTLLRPARRLSRRPLTTSTTCSSRSRGSCWGSISGSAARAAAEIRAETSPPPPRAGRASRHTHHLHHLRRRRADGCRAGSAWTATTRGGRRRTRGRFERPPHATRYMRAGCRSCKVECSCAGPSIIEPIEPHEKNRERKSKKIGVGRSVRPSVNDRERPESSTSIQACEASIKRPRRAERRGPRTTPSVFTLQTPVYTHLPHAMRRSIRSGPRTRARASVHLSCRLSL